MMQRESVVAASLGFLAALGMMNMISANTNASLGSPELASCYAKNVQLVVDMDRIKADVSRLAVVSPPSERRAKPCPVCPAAAAAAAVDLPAVAAAAIPCPVCLACSAAVPAVAPAAAAPTPGGLDLSAPVSIIGDGKGFAMLQPSRGIKTVIIEIGLLDTVMDTMNEHQWMIGVEGSLSNIMK